MKALRERLGFTQQEFAHLLKASMTSVSRWERGDRQMLLTLTQIQALLGLIEKAEWSFEDFVNSTQNFNGEATD